MITSKLLSKFGQLGRIMQQETIKDLSPRCSTNQGKETSYNPSYLGHFKVFERDENSFRTPYSRRDYYKISLILGTGELHYANRWIKVDRPALLFSNPIIPYAWESNSTEQAGWFCLFTEDFIQQPSRQIALQESPFFKVNGDPLYFLNQVQIDEISYLFKKMLNEPESGYIHKDDVIRNYLYLLIHEAMKMQAQQKFQTQSNASVRISHLFLELLERQFPIDSTSFELKIKTPHDFAYNLSIHVNHLNRAVKEVTGKSTSKLISSRISQEAKVLLQFTQWNISEIAYSLGFENPSYFTNFFKKNTGLSPTSFREHARHTKS